MNYFIRTFGCKTNQYESELMKELVMQKGDNVVDNYCDTDIVVINSCCVTQTAERDVYKFIRRVFHESKKTKEIYLVGCYAEYIKKHNLYKNFFSRLVVNISVKFFGNKEKYRFLNCVSDDNCIIKKFFGIQRAYVKIQDGCNNFCSYCIVPYLRNKLVNKPVDVVLKEIENLVKNNFVEIYFVGTNIGKYSYKDTEKIYDFIDLSEKVLIEFPEIVLLYTSLEPVDLTEKFFEFLQKYRTRIFPHFHIPLQSADNKVLEDMRRKYTLEEYAKKIEKLRKIIPNLILSSDIIVGFPTETQQQFLNTVKFIEKINFNWVHVFPYSARIGTECYKKYGVYVPYDVKKRVREIIKLNKILGEDYFKQLCKI
jgi:threonylcarbamoyladenosine tRNA methylthiotransferase MtaB